MILTKAAMARVIIQALYLLPALPPADNKQVMRLARRGTVDGLKHQHALACKALHAHAVGRREPSVIEVESYIDQLEADD